MTRGLYIASDSSITLSARAMPVSMQGGADQSVFFDRFARADGALAAPWIGGAGYAISSGKVVNNPTLSEEALTNGGCETFTDGLADGWAEVGTPTTTQEDVIKQAGAHSQKFEGAAYPDGVHSRILRGTNLFGIGSVYGYCASGSVALELRTNSGGYSWKSQALTAAEWTQIAGSGVAFGLSVGPNAWASGAVATVGYVDSASLKWITAANAMKLVWGRQGNVAIGYLPTHTVGHAIGLVLCCDSPANPLNYILATYNGTGTYLLLHKVLNGVISLVSDAYEIAPTFAVGARFGIEKNGTTIRLIYNGAQAGNLHTISDAAIVDNRYHGIVTLSALNQIDDFGMQDHAIRIGVVGTSIAATANSWAVMLCRDARWAAARVISHAVSGACVVYTAGAPADMVDQVTSAATDDADIIIVELGTNDTDSADVQTTYATQIAVLQASNPRARIYGMGILPKTVEGARTANNVRIAAACAAAGITYWDTDGWITPATDTIDGLHPNAAGHAKIATQVLTQL